MHRSASDVSNVSSFIDSYRPLSTSIDTIAAAAFISTYIDFTIHSYRYEFALPQRHPVNPFVVTIYLILSSPNRSWSKFIKSYRFKSGGESNIDFIIHLIDSYRLKSIKFYQVNSMLISIRIQAAPIIIHSYRKYQ